MTPAAASLQKRVLKHSGLITRDAFLYIEPGNSAQNNDRFAQCASCLLWTNGTANLCGILGPGVKAYGDSSCGLYVPGKPECDPKDAEPLVTSAEAGLVHRQVRCENCTYFSRKNDEATRGVCGLYERLNKQSDFDLDADVHKHGCCNAQTPG